MAPLYLVTLFGLSVSGRELAIAAVVVVAVVALVAFLVMRARRPR